MVKGTCLQTLMAPVQLARTQVKLDAQIVPAPEVHLQQQEALAYPFPSHSLMNTY